MALQVASVLGSDRVQGWAQLSDQERLWLTRGIDPSAASPQGIITPQSRQELAQVMELVQTERWRIMPTGSGTKLGWGRWRSPIDWVLKCDRLNHVVERDPGDLTISVEAGMTLGALQRELASHRQFLPVDPSYPETATLGGIVATADSGSLRQGYGGVRDMLLGIEFVRHDGQRSQAGGKVVKNVAGYDLMKLSTGAYGTLGVISRLTWRVYPVPEIWHTLAITGDLNALSQLAQRILASPLTPVALDWAQLSSALAPLPLDGSLPTDHGSEPWLLARFASVPASVEAQVATVMDGASALGLTVMGLQGDKESQLWQGLSRAIAPPIDSQMLPMENPLQLKFGILSTEVPPLLRMIQTQLPEAITQVRAGSGVGRLYYPTMTDPAITLTALQTLRHYCQTHQGFLSILDASPAIKTQLDPWGYRGNGQSMAIALRRQFDPHRLINPNCFIV